MHIFASYKNHEPFYNSVVDLERSQGREVHVHWPDEGRATKGILRKGVRGVLRRAAPHRRARVRLYLEEYYGLGDLIFIYLFGVLHRNVHISLCLHNLNKWFLLEYRPSARRFATYFTAARITRRSNELVVTSASLRDYAQRLSKFSCEVRVIPFSLGRGRPVLALGGAPLIAIPGTVDESRRNYPMVLDACRQLAADGVQFRLALLCRLQKSKLSTALRADLEDFGSRFPQVLVTFEEFIPDEEYRAWVAEATALIANVQPYFRGESDTTEIYGVSKESATRTWADSYDKPCLIPYEMRAGVRVQNYYRYANAVELRAHLQQLIAARARTN